MQLGPTITHGFGDVGKCGQAEKFVARALPSKGSMNGGGAAPVPVGLSFFKSRRTALDLATGTCAHAALSDELHHMHIDQKGHFMANVAGHLTGPCNHEAHPADMPGEDCSYLGISIVSDDRT